MDEIETEIPVIPQTVQADHKEDAQDIQALISSQPVPTVATIKVQEQESSTQDKIHEKKDTKKVQENNHENASEKKSKIAKKDVSHKASDESPISPKNKVSDKYQTRKSSAKSQSEQEIESAAGTGIFSLHQETNTIETNTPQSKPAVNESRIEGDWIVRLESGGKKSSKGSRVHCKLMKLSSTIKFFDLYANLKKKKNCLI